MVLEIRSRTMPDVSRRNRDALVISDIWTNSSSESTAGSSICGGLWIRMVMSSIFCCSLGVISVQPQAQRFLSLHGVVRKLFCVARHLLRSTHHRLLRSRSFEVWRTVTAA